MKLSTILQPDSPTRGYGRRLGILNDLGGHLRPADHPDCGAFQSNEPSTNQ